MHIVSKCVNVCNARTMLRGTTQIDACTRLCKYLRVGSESSTKTAHIEESKKTVTSLTTTTPTPQTVET